MASIVRRQGPFAEGQGGLTVGEAHGSSARTLASARAALAHSRGFSPRRALPFMGPAFIASVAYVDPGNFATNLQAGSRVG